jgi:hypothetical protein
LEQVIAAAEHETTKELETRGEPVASTVAITEERAEVAGPIVPVEGDFASREMDDGKLYHGTLELDIPPPVDSIHLGRFLKHLREVPDLQLLLVGDSAGKKTRVTVFIGKPLPLLSVLKEMTPVKSVVERENSIQVVLETSTGK